jgi:glucokinase
MNAAANGPWRLVADVGGTNVRFARASESGALADRRDFRSADFASFDDALETYLKGHDRSACRGAAIAAAGPVIGNGVQLTNGPWRIEAGDVAHFVAGGPVRILNDLEAAALSLPHLAAADMADLGQVEPLREPGAPRLAVNVGTGFGAAALMAVGDGWMAHGGEAGHMVLGADGREEFEILEAFGTAAVSVEDVLSGPGLARLYRHIAALKHGAASDLRSSRKVFDLSAHDPAAAQAVHMFTRFLGRVCADLVLASAAWGGLALFGSVARGWYAHGDHALFRRTFDGDGMMAANLARVPCAMVLNDDAPLIGLARGT